MKYEFKGTQGIWEVQKDEDDYCYSVIKAPYNLYEGTEFICSEIQQGYDDGEFDANLISAAPDLLEAAIHFLENPSVDKGTDSYNKFKLAVHKALSIKE